MRVFVAGAAGAIGRQLIPQLQGLNCQDSHSWRLPGVSW